jgi:hypothetical protein
MTNWKAKILRRSRAVSLPAKKVDMARSTIAYAQVEFAGLWVALKVLVRLEGERLGSHNLVALVDSGADHILV